MNKLMKLGEIHPDMERYLQEDCYCTGEIYDTSGFFYQIFRAEDECRVFAKNEGRTAVVAKSSMSENCDPQAIIFWHDDEENPGRIIEARRVDATENNIGILSSIVKGEKPDGRKIDEFEDGNRAKAINEVFSIADAIIYD